MQASFIKTDNHTDQHMQLSSVLYSGIYKGYVRHRRFTPTENHFQYNVFMVYLDLQEIDQVFAQTKLWSAGSFSLVWFRRKDFFDGSHQGSLYEAVANKVEEETGARPCGPIRMLTNLRYFGFIINPITCYYCFDKTGQQLQTVVAEVTNTPWGDRCHYVLDFSDQHSEKQYTVFDKTMHVSPFQPMNLYYTWRSKRPADDIVIHLDVFKKIEEKSEMIGDIANHAMSSTDGLLKSTKDIQPVLDATLVLQREEMTASNMRRIVLRYPWMTCKVVAGIYWQALRLWCKGIPFFGRVSKTDSHA